MNQSTEPIPFARPAIGAGEEEAVLRVLRSGWLTTGAEASKLEGRYAAAVAPDAEAVAVSSATAGLHLVFEALALPPGSQVALSPYTFTASAEILRYLGLHPRFVDICDENCRLDLAALEKTLEQSPEIRAVMAIHIAGYPEDMPGLHGLAERRGLPVVEDAAHRLPRGGTGAVPHPASAAGVFSLYATKPVTAGEGGVVVTRREELAARARTMRLHGIDRDVWRRYRDTRASWQYDVVEAGYKYNLPDLLAAIARVQFDSAESRRTRRREIARRYNAAFADRDYLSIPEEHPEHDWHLYRLSLQTDRLSGDRDAFAKALRERGIGTSVHYIPLHHFSYYRRAYGLTPADLPVATAVYERSLSLPLYASLTDEEVERVVEAVLAVGDAAYRRSARVAGE